MQLHVFGKIQITKQKKNSQGMCKEEDNIILSQEDIWWCQHLHKGFYQEVRIDQ